MFRTFVESRTARGAKGYAVGGKKVKFEGIGWAGGRRRGGLGLEKVKKKIEGKLL